METIFVLVKADATHAESMLEKLRGVEGLAFAHAVTGSYDFIISLEGPELAALLSRSMKKIGHMEGIKSTETLVAIKLD